MDVAAITAALKREFCDSLRLLPDGEERFFVVTPFGYDDGDRLSIILKRDLGGDWLLSDEGHSFLHLGYDVDDRDLAKGARAELVERTLSAFRIQNRDGELNCRLDGQDAAASLFRFIQALLKIDGVRQFGREHVASKFVADFCHFIESRVPSTRRQAKWHHQERDPSGLYTADYRVNSRARPLYLFALPTVERVNAATITLLEFERWKIAGDSVGILENPNKVPSKVREKLANVGAHVFTSLAIAEDGISDLYPDVFGAVALNTI